VHHVKLYVLHLRPFSHTGSEDDLIAASGDGQSIMYMGAKSTCTSFVVYLVDEIAAVPGTYTPRDVTPWLNASNLVVGQAALSGDGLTFVGVSADGLSLKPAKRSAMQLIDFGTPSASDFAVINGFLAGTAGKSRVPALSSDGRELYYTINGISAAADGIYRSVRSSGSGAFPAGARVTVLTSDYEFVTGVSSDRLALFVFKGFAGWVFTCTSTRPSSPTLTPRTRHRRSPTGSTSRSATAASWSPLLRPPPAAPTRRSPSCIASESEARAYRRTQSPTSSPSGVLSKSPQGLPGAGWRPSVNVIS
jgi:hypothetical protein